MFENDLFENDIKDKQEFRTELVQIGASEGWELGLDLVQISGYLVFPRVCMSPQLNNIPIYFCQSQMGGALYVDIGKL